MLPDLPPTVWAAVVFFTLLAGFVKGTVGFAMPMIMISSLGSILAPEVALAALILPTLATNIFQATRNGFAAAMGSARKHWLYLTTVMVILAFSAQLVRRLPEQTLLLIIGVPVVVFAITLLAGLRFTIGPSWRVRAQLMIGGFAGFMGGMSGIWGPPTVTYLTALDTPKEEQLRVQGVVYGLGAVVLTAAHVKSGVLNGSTAGLSALLLVPAVIGVFAGFQVADRLDQARFRKATLLVLVLAGLNLIRRALFG